MQIKSDYSFLQKIRLVVWVIRTKLMFRDARLIRFPFDCRGKSFIKVGKGFTTGVGCRLEVFKFVVNNEPGKKMLIGDNVQINDHVHISALKKVSIGNNVLIAGNVYISDNTHGLYDDSNHTSTPNQTPKEREYIIKPVIIEDNVWIGEGAIVLPGVTIGYGSVVGAHSVVAHSVPKGTIVVGSPARVVKRFDEETGKWQRV